MDYKDDLKNEMEKDNKDINISNTLTRDQSFENFEIISEKSENKQMLNDEFIIDSDYKFIFYKKLGNLFTFFYIDQEPLVVIGPHWPFFVCLFSTMSFSSFMFLFSLWNKLLEFFKFIGVLTYIIYSISYILTAFGNPGLPKRKCWINGKSVYSDLKNFKICNVCRVIMNLDENTIHCDDCEVCIEGNNY